MKKVHVVIVMLLVFAASVQADPAPWRCQDFSHYKVSETFSGTPAQPDFANSPDSKGFESQILDRYTGEANYAGHFQAVSWGCGTGCQVYAVVDLKNGKITFVPRQSQYGAKFELDSSLFILDPVERVDVLRYAETDSYVWDESTGGFREMKECHIVHEQPYQ